MSNAKPIVAAEVPSLEGSPYPEPYAARATSSAFQPLADQFGLAQFGVNLVTLDPGAQSGLRHWHSLEDEFLYVLEGELTLRRDGGECRLGPGMCIGFKAGDKDAHVTLNRGEAVAKYLIVGSRIAGDNAFYPDDDLAWLDLGEGPVPVHKDGGPYKQD